VDLFELASKLSGAGLATLLIFILVGGWKRMWVWGYQLEQLRTDMKEQLLDERAEKQEWKSLALRNLEVAKVLVSGPAPIPGGGSAQ
jgi:hypothetical protein